MAWVLLLGGILFEVVGTTFMKLSQGLTRLGPAVGMFASYLVSLALLTLAMKRIDLSVGYAIWSGLGTALIATIGILWFREPASALKIASIGVIIIGIIGLNLSGTQ